MFIEALFLIAKILTRPMMNKWVKNIYIHMIKYYSLIKRKKILLFGTIFVDHEAILPCEVKSDKEK